MNCSQKYASNHTESVCREEWLHRKNVIRTNLLIYKEGKIKTNKQNPRKNPENKSSILFT